MCTIEFLLQFLCTSISEYLEKHNDTRKSVFDLYDVLTTFDKEYITDHKKVYEICKNKLIPQFLEIKEFLIKIQSTYNSEQLNLGDMLQQELKLMDQIIEEATQKIKDVYAGSMGKTSGLKLKLNEKILGTCTNLMEAIKVLIMKSRNLQEEIVSQGKGILSILLEIFEYISNCDFNFYDNE